MPDDTAFEEYISDPAKPVPFVRRPIKAMGYDEGNTWPRWLVDDQRDASGRPDVATFISGTLPLAGPDEGQILHVPEGRTRAAK